MHRPTTHFRPVACIPVRRHVGVVGVDVIGVQLVAQLAESGAHVHRPPAAPQVVPAGSSAMKVDVRY